MRSRALLLLLTLSAPTFAQEDFSRRFPGGVGSSSSTSGAMNLYVETTGNDSASCTSVLAPCLTIQGAVDKIPKLVKHPVVVTVGAGTFTTGANISGFAFDTGQTAARQASITVQGTFSNFTPATGTATGTLTAAANASATTVTWSTWTDNTQSWTVNDLIGKVVEFSTGMSCMITSNTATTFTTGHRLSELIPIAGTTYAIRDWTTFIDNFSTTYRFGTSYLWVNRGGSFLVNVPNTVQNSVEGTVIIQRFQFQPGPIVMTGVLATSGNVAVRYNKVATSVNGFNKLVQFESDGNLLAQSNAIYGISTTNAINLEGHGVPQTIKLINNYMLGGNCLGCFTGSMGKFISLGNYVDITGSAGSPYRFSTVTDGSMRFDILTGGVFCVRGFGGFSGADSTSFAIDGTQCNNSTSYKFSFNGGIWKFDSLGIGASTGANTSGTSMVVMGSGTKVQWSSSTNFTSNGTSDFIINEAGGPIQSITQTQLRSNASYKSFVTLPQGTSIVEP